MPAISDIDVRTGAWPASSSIASMPMVVASRSVICVRMRNTSPSTGRALTYREMLVRYARIRGLRRLIRSVPVPLPELAGHWIDLLTPIPYSIAEPLVESLRTQVVVKDHSARTVFRVNPTGYDDAVRLALTRMAEDTVVTTWASSLSSLSQEQGDEDILGEHEGMLLDRKRRRVKASPERMFDAICELGASRDGSPAIGSGSSAA